MKLSSWYSSNYESRLSGRYIHLDHITPLLDDYRKTYPISVVGTSENGKDISLIQLGNGPRRVLGWSQMHGNESTTTKAIFDFLAFVSQKKKFQKEIKSFFNTYAFFIIPVLNPDGSELYTRENANKIDLNRDAQELSQSESKCLNRVFNEVKPELCLNLHDQRTMYSLPNFKSATVSFLAPAANKERTITESRKMAMGHIVDMRNTLEAIIPGQIGRYDDTFNENCVGDTFTKAGVPTILFEAGHYQGDYQREKTRELIFYALLRLFDLGEERGQIGNYKSYFDIPENGKRFKDVIIRNVLLKDNEDLTSLGISYEETLENGAVRWVPVLQDIGALTEFKGHKEIDAGGVEILLNSHENVIVNEKVVTIIEKNAKTRVIFQDSRPVSD